MSDGQRNPLVIIGAGGFGRELLDIVEAINREAHVFDFLGFLDDGDPDHELIAARGTTVLGPVAHLKDVAADYVIGIASPLARRQIDTLAIGLGRRAATLRHPTATFGSDVLLGPGTVVCSHVSMTTHIRTGRHVHLNINCTVGHDVVAGDYVTVMPGVNVSGEVTLGDDVTLGTGCAVIQGVDIAPMAYVGAGAAVVRSVLPGVTVGGVPARPLRHSPPE